MSNLVAEMKFKDAVSWLPQYIVSNRVQLSESVLEKSDTSVLKVSDVTDAFLSGNVHAAYDIMINIFRDGYVNGCLQLKAKSPLL